MNDRLAIIGDGVDDDEEIYLETWNGTQVFKYTKRPHLLLDFATLRREEDVTSWRRRHAVNAVQDSARRQKREYQTGLNTGHISGVCKGQRRDRGSRRPEVRPAACSPSLDSPYSGGPLDEATWNKHVYLFARSA